MKYQKQYDEFCQDIIQQYLLMLDNFQINDAVLSWLSENLISPDEWLDKNEKRLNFEDREWNYTFRSGEQVVVADDIPESELRRAFSYNHRGYFDGVCFYFDLTQFIGKVGTVLSCRTDLMCMWGGSYFCEVDFDGEILQCCCRYFNKEK